MHRGAGTFVLAARPVHHGWSPSVTEVNFLRQIKGMGLVLKKSPASLRGS